MTKRFWDYRPQNMMLHVVRSIARQLQISRIYAVSNFEFYDSTLLVEPQKTIEEVVSHKRNLYRKRFCLLNEIDMEISDAIKPYLVNELYNGQHENSFTNTVAATLNKN